MGAMRGSVAATGRPAAGGDGRVVGARVVDASHVRIRAVEVVG